MFDDATIQAVISEKQAGFAFDAGCISATRDVFTSRMQTYVAETGKYLEAAVISEIGNNTFDHNFVYAKDFPRGVCCNLSYHGNLVVIADYGRGVRQSLSCVVPDIHTDIEAVEIAFTKRISGRAPEQRGNGLKFVSETIQQNNWQLYFHSGTGCAAINGAGIRFFASPTAVVGCLAIIEFDGGAQ
jgi:hypothetical protein